VSCDTENLFKLKKGLRVEFVTTGPCGYGDGIKYATSLRPKGVSWSEWKLESRREIFDKTWDEIYGIGSKVIEVMRDFKYGELLDRI